MKWNKTPRTMSLILMLAFLAGFAGHAIGAEKQVVKFGFGHRLDAAEEARIYTPFLQYLEKKTGYKFEPRFVQKSESMPDILGKGEVQFMAMGSVEYIHTKEKYGAIPVVRGLNSQGKAEYQAAIITKPDSSIKKIGDIRGKSFAFGSDSSTQGHLIPRTMLLKVGISINDLKESTYTGAHDKVGEAVISGKYDAGGLQDTLAKDLEKKGLVRIVAMSDNYPSSGVAANASVDPKVIEAVKKALLEFDPLGKDKEELYHWDRTEMPNGFIKATGSDYDSIKDAMMKLGFLKK